MFLFCVVFNETMKDDDDDDDDDEYSRRSSSWSLSLYSDFLALSLSALARVMQFGEIFCAQKELHLFAFVVLIYQSVCKLELWKAFNDVEYACAFSNDQMYEKLYRTHRIRTASRSCEYACEVSNH